MERRIYLDNAATTKIKDEVFDKMLPYFKENYANPSAIYSLADEARKKTEEARRNVADLIKALPAEIFFTSGGSEADNWALKMTAEKLASKGKHIITGKVEHHAILRTCEYLEGKGFEVTYLDVDSQGKISLDELKAAIRKDTILISIMTANNEIGTIMPVHDIGKIAHENGVLFHTDAVQAFGHIPIDVNDMNIDLLSASGHKFGGPKGTGILFIRKGADIGSYIHGGAQERSKRAGTLNVAGIIGMGEAARLAAGSLINVGEEMIKLRDYMVKRILNEIADTTLNGHPVDRLPNNINISFKNVEGDSLLILLDQAGIYASSGSACSSGSVEPSHVLTSIGVSRQLARCSLRFTLGEDTTKDDIDYVVEKLIMITGRLRSLSSCKK